VGWYQITPGKKVQYLFPACCKVFFITKSLVNGKIFTQWHYLQPAWSAWRRQEVPPPLSPTFHTALSWPTYAVALGTEQQSHSLPVGQRLLGIPPAYEGAFSTARGPWWSGMKHLNSFHSRVAEAWTSKVSSFVYNSIFQNNPGFKAMMYWS
jgi:hypothetical protein